MSYKQKRESIKEDVKSQIVFYKRGTKKQQDLAMKMEELANGIACFQCLDTKQSWYFRREHHRMDGNGDYYTMSCAVCSDDKWIENNKTSTLYGVSGMKLFNKENHSGVERFKELQNLTYTLYPELNEPEPAYLETEKNNVSVKKSTYDLKLEVGNIVNKCQEIFRGYCGDITSIASLLSSIEVSISNCENTNKQEQVLCQELDEQKFIYVKIQNNSITKKKAILGLCEYNKYKLDIDIHLYKLKPDNVSAYKQCKNIVNKLAVNDIDEVSMIFLNL